MATAAAFSVNAKSTGVSTTVPDDDIARLMYYLNCVTVGVGIDVLPDELTSYHNYRWLTVQQQALVFKMALELSPDEFIGKLLFRDDAGEICKSTTNEFVTLTTACDLVSVQRDVVIAGKVQDVTKVMFFRTAWLDKNYNKPIERIAINVLGSKHCLHCFGESGLCKCTKNCARQGGSRCSSSSGGFRFLIAPTSTIRPSVSSSNLRPVHSQVNCDGCSQRGIEGTRYKCNVCYDYDLCHGCYTRNVHDLRHSFNKMDRPGAAPVRLAPRKSPSPPPAPPPYKSSTSSLFSFGRSSSSSAASNASSPRSDVKFKKDDVVILTGLARAEMNGKRATILSVDHGAKKAQIRVLGMDNTFKVKFEHLKADKDDSDEELF